LLDDACMRILLAIAIAITSSCTEGSDAFPFYAHAYSGTDWNFAFGPGTPLHDGVTCPAFAARTMHMPNTDGMQCDAGCTCGLSLSEGCSGDVVETDYVLLEYFQACADHSQLHLDQDVDPSNLVFRAYWDAPGSSYDCVYDLGLSEIK
jgi:hypothetical protein